MKFYAAERKKELIPFAMLWMELESIMLSEISQAVRDKIHTSKLRDALEYLVYSSFTLMINIFTHNSFKYSLNFFC